MNGLIAGPALVVLLVACCSASNLTNLFNPTPIDCGMASNGVNTCFDTAIATCAPANVRIAEVPIEVTINGSHDSNDCDIQLTGISLSSWENELQTTSPSDYANVEQELSTPGYQTVMGGFEGKTASCVIPKGAFDTISSDQMLQVCHGSLMTYIENMMSASNSNNGY